LRFERDDEDREVGARGISQGGQVMSVSFASADQVMSVGLRV